MLRNSSKLTMEIKDKEVAIAILQGLILRKHDASSRIALNLIETANELRDKESALQAVALLRLFKDDVAAERVADVMRRRAPYIIGRQEKEVISELHKTLCLFKESAALGIVNAWSSATYNDDWGDEDGGLAICRIMKQKEIVKDVNNLSPRVAGDVAGYLADIANYLRDPDSVINASRAIMSHTDDVNAVLTVAKHLANVALNLREPDDSMHITWKVVGEKAKEAFANEIEKSRTNAKEIMDSLKRS